MPLDFHVSPWHFDSGASSKIDDVLAGDGGLLHVLPLTVFIIFQIKGVLFVFIFVKVPVLMFNSPPPTNRSDVS